MWNNSPEIAEVAATVSVDFFSMFASAEIRLARMHHSQIVIPQSQGVQWIEGVLVL